MSNKQHPSIKLNPVTSSQIAAIGHDPATNMQLSQSEAITAALKAVDGGLATKGVAALPEIFKIHDLERFMPTRRRLRGIMQTESIPNFSLYVKENREPGAVVFVDAANMEACAVLNLGTTASPGHSDNTAHLKAKKTAAFTELSRLTSGNQLTQKAVAEFFEDWQPMIWCEKGGEPVPVRKAIAAIRKLTIESMRKLEVSDQQLSVSRSAFENVEATSEEPIPDVIRFTCVPYKDLSDRAFYLRMSLITNADKQLQLPSLSLRIIKIEEHEEQMAEQFAGKIRQVISDEVAVLLGKYKTAS